MIYMYCTCTVYLSRLSMDIVNLSLIIVLFSTATLHGVVQSYQCSNDGGSDCKAAHSAVLHDVTSNSLPVEKKIIVNPCNDVERDTVKLYNTTVWLVNNTLKYCPLDQYNDVDYGFPVYRVQTTSTSASPYQPLIFVSRSDKDVQTWSLPFKPRSFPSHFNSTNRIICSTIFRDNNTVDERIAMYIDAFTSNVEETHYTVTIEPVNEFELMLNTTVEFSISANSPEIRYFKFPDDVQNVIVTTSSNSGGCAFVSVQNASCPVNDFLQSDCSIGVFQTMITDSSLVIKAGDTITGDDFFVVIIVVDSSYCNQISQEEVITVSTISVNLTITTLHSASQYVGAIILPVGVFLVLGLIISFTFVFPILHCTRRPPLVKNCCTSKEYLEDDDVDDSETITLGSTVNQIKMNSKTEENTDQLKTQMNALLQSGIERELLTKTSITIPDMLKKPTPLLERQYTVYGWNTITVGIFYALPAFQLVLSQQLLLNISGNQDLCYYNFKCARPLGALSTFNAVWSNIGYFILGFFFIVIVAIRHFKYRLRRKKEPSKSQNYGLPQFYGIYYAMGVALMTEGFMSAFYHICPSDNNFQFDTAFMFIIGGLLIIKVFQARHSDIHTNAFVAFLAFAVVIFLTLIGIFTGSTFYWPTRIVLLILVLTAIIIFSISFYFFHDWKLSNWIELRTYYRIFNWFKSWCIRCNSKENCALLQPKQKIWFFKLFFAITCNFIIVFSLIFSQNGVATIVLYLFILNFGIYSAIYLFSKLCYREPWTMKPIIYLVVLIVAWAVSLYFYVNNVAQWELSPAQSRALNKECIVLGFYDNHDVWHFLSAVAMFFSFLFLLTLDDGLNGARRDKINVF